MEFKLNNSIIIGKWLSGTRPTLNGEFTNELLCRGWINFPDERKYDILYDPSTCTIIWSNNSKWKRLIATCGQNQLKSIFSIASIFFVFGQKNHL